MSAEIIFGALEYLFILSLFFRINDTHGFLFWAKSFLFENFSSVLENITCSASHIRQESSLNSGIFSEFGLILGRLSILFYVHLLSSDQFSIFMIVCCLFII